MGIDRDGWESWCVNVERACASGGEGLRSAFSARPFRAWRSCHPECWDRLFDALVGLGGRGDAETSWTSVAYALEVAVAQYGPPYGPHTPRDHETNFARRVLSLLPAATTVLVREPGRVLEWIDDLIQAEWLVHLGVKSVWEPLREVEAWIESLAAEEAAKTAARIAYAHARAPWATARPLLFDALDSDDDLVRAVAARTIGHRYYSGPGDMTPRFGEVIELVAQNEILRPGIAGPLLDHRFRKFEALSGIQPDDFIFRILAGRTASDPCPFPDKSIDFIACELFGGRADCIRRLQDLGLGALALKAATHVWERIPDLEPLLIELGASPDDETCRQASWHLVAHYRRLHPEGRRRGFVRQASFLWGDVYTELRLSGDGSRHPHAVILYPLLGSSFDDSDAAWCINAVLPVALRGEEVLWRPGKRWSLSRTGAVLEYSSGARVCLLFEGEPRREAWRMDCGTLAQQRWAQITVVWDGPADAWHPELLVNGIFREGGTTRLFGQSSDEPAGHAGDAGRFP